MHQLAYLIDPHTGAILGRFQLKAIRMRTGCQQQATTTNTAWLVALGLLAQQEICQSAGKITLPRAAWPMQQVSMGMLRASRQLLPQALLPGIAVSHGNAPQASAPGHQ
jgi:hypothetical protein